MRGGGGGPARGGFRHRSVECPGSRRRSAQLCPGPSLGPGWPRRGARGGPGLAGQAACAAGTGPEGPRLRRPPARRGSREHASSPGRRRRAMQRAGGGRRGRSARVQHPFPSVSDSPGRAGGINFSANLGLGWAPHGQGRRTHTHTHLAPGQIRAAGSQERVTEGGRKGTPFGVWTWAAKKKPGAKEKGSLRRCKGRTRALSAPDFPPRGRRASLLRD